MDIKEILSERLHNLLEELDMSQAELSKRSSVTEATISNFLNCKQLPKLEVVSKIADVLDVSVDYLLGKTNVRQIANDSMQIAASTKNGIDLSDICDEDKDTIMNIVRMARKKGKGE